MKYSSPKICVDKKDVREHSRFDIYTEKIHFLYDQGPPALFVSVVNAILFVAVEWQEHAHWKLVLWLCCLATILGARLLIIHTYKNGMLLRGIKFWARVYFIGIIATALCWGSIGYFFFTPESPVHITFMTFLLGGIVAGSIPVLASLKITVYSYIVPCLFPIAIQFFAHEEMVMHVMGVMVLSYAAMMTLTGLKIHKSVHSTLLLKKDYNSLVVQLMDARDRLQKTSQSQRLYEKAKQADAAKSEFLANMSHEIRTPLTAVLGYTDVLLSDRKLDSTLKGYVEAIGKGGNHLLDLINDVLDISKIEAGKMELYMESSSIYEILSDLGMMISSKTQEQNNHFGIEYCWPLPEKIITDPIRLRQALINLVGNANKFTENGFITLRVRADKAEKCIIFDVIDTGIGIDADHLDTLFDPFVQADNSSTRVHGGTGLGLTITKRIVNMLGGVLTVESTPGEGSIFQIKIFSKELSHQEFIDCLPEKNKSSKNSYIYSTDVQLFQGRALVVEDGVENQKIVSYLLEQAGLEVEIAENGKEGVEKALKNNFKIIFMDIQMPIMDGYSATRILRREGYDRPIIALTADALANQVQKCYDAGCSDYLGKPFRKTQFLEILQRHISCESSNV